MSNKLICTCQVELDGTVIDPGQLNSENPVVRCADYDQYGAYTDDTQMGFSLYEEYPGEAQLSEYIASDTLMDNGFIVDMEGFDSSLVVNEGFGIVPMNAPIAPRINTPGANAVVSRTGFDASWLRSPDSTRYTVSVIHLTPHGNVIVVRDRQVPTVHHLQLQQTHIQRGVLVPGGQYRIEIRAWRNNIASNIASRNFMVRREFTVWELDEAIRIGGTHRPCNQYVNHVLNQLNIRIANGNGTTTPVVDGMLSWLNSANNRTWLGLGTNFQEAWRRAQLGFPTIAIAPLVSPVWRAVERRWRDSIQHVAMVIPRSPSPNNIGALMLASGGATPGLNKALSAVWTAGSPNLYPHPNYGGSLVRSKTPRSHIRFFTFIG